MIFLLSSIAFTATHCALLPLADKLRRGPDEKAPATIATLAADPLLNFEHPGLVQRREEHNVANYICMVCDYFPTGITRSYDVTTDPEPLIRDYSQAADQAGWEPVARFCNPDTRGVDLRLEKSFDDIDALARFWIEPSRRDDPASLERQRTASVYFDVDAWYGSPRTPIAERGYADCLD